MTTHRAFRRSDRAFRRSAGAALVLLLAAAPVAAHAPLVALDAHDTPSTALLLEDPTLSRAVGATISAPGEVDWYRMDLRAGDPLVVGMTMPDAVGGIPATFILAGPGLPAPDPANVDAVAIAAVAGTEGAIAFQPVADPPLEDHAGMGFVNYGMIVMEAPADGTYYVAAFAIDPAATGKYVLAPGVREEFGIDAIAGYMALADLFAAPWPPAPETASAG
jgi:hypothetical protein